MQISSVMKTMKPFYTYTFDYSKFDQTVPLELQLLACRTIRNLLDIRGLEQWWDAMQTNLIKGAVYHPRFGGVLQRKRGLLSGSYFTNIIGSLVNIILLCYALVCIQQQSIVRKIFVHGDDFVIACDKPLNTSEFRKVIESFGMSINESKVGSSNPGDDRTHFLGSE